MLEVVVDKDDEWGGGGEEQKQGDEKTKWKESLMMFTSTLNLLISMGENALKNDDEKTEKPNDVESENPTSDDKKDEEVHEFDKEPKEK